MQAAWRRRGALAWALGPLALAYGAVVTVRRALYRHGVLAVHRLPVPVVVVGNLVVGGAGKTPTVIAVVESLRRQGWRPGIVSRGYGGRGRGVREVAATDDARDRGDEPLLLRRRTGAPVVVGADRPAAAAALLAAHPDTDVIVADDGLQHHALARDLEVIVFDERGVGNGWVLPAGPLREPRPARPPAGALVVYSTDVVSTPWPGVAGVRRLVGLVRWADWRAGRSDAAEPVATLVGRPVTAVAGIARPERFFAMLRTAGLAPRPLPLPDHAELRAAPWPPDAGCVVVTEKDAVKLDPAWCDPATGVDVRVAPLDFRLPPAFEAALRSRLPRPGRPPSPPDGNPPAEPARVPGLQGAARTPAAAAASAAGTGLPGRRPGVSGP